MFFSFACELGICKEVGRLGALERRRRREELAQVRLPERLLLLLPVLEHAVREELPDSKKQNVFSCLLLNVAPPLLPYAI